MSEPYIGEIRIFPYDSVPVGWAPCDGQILQISQNSALFSIIGTAYGGNGATTFALPDLRGRVPLQPGIGPGLSARTRGGTGGEATVTLTEVQLPSHKHRLAAARRLGNLGTPSADAALARGPEPRYAGPGGSTATLAPESLATSASVPHNNLQPYAVLNICIALVGLFPSE